MAHWAGSFKILVIEFVTCGNHKTSNIHKFQVDHELFNYVTKFFCETLSAVLAMPSISVFGELSDVFVTYIMMLL